MAPMVYVAVGGHRPYRGGGGCRMLAMSTTCVGDEEVHAMTRSVATPTLELYWVPLGADTTIVRWSGRTYERLIAVAERRPACALYHSALIARDGGTAVTVEVAPVPDGRGRTVRGVVAEGPVGSKLLGRWRPFRYEVRRWTDGVIPDLHHAVASPVEITSDPDRVTAALETLAGVPTPVWGRDECHLGEMWNSNSVVSWTLTSCDLMRADLRPPDGGRAPGWQAGIDLARREAPLRLAGVTHG